ncbi:hypothetical protein MTO96_037317 [Rhipicephalus appendiculatus]
MNVISHLVFLDGYEPCEAKMAIPVLALQRPGSRMTKLNVADLEMNPHTSKLLIDALDANDTRHGAGHRGLRLRLWVPSTGLPSGSRSIWPIRRSESWF